FCSLLSTSTISHDLCPQDARLRLLPLDPGELYTSMALVRPLPSFRVSSWGPYLCYFNCLRQTEPYLKVPKCVLTSLRPYKRAPSKLPFVDEFLAAVDESTPASLREAPLRTGQIHIALRRKMKSCERRVFDLDVSGHPAFFVSFGERREQEAVGEASLGHLETGWRVMFLRNSKVLNPGFIADVMAVFSLISQSLRTGEPMHQVIPMNLLDRLFYHDAHGHARTPLVPPEGFNGQPVDVEGIKSVSYMYYASSIVAVYQLLHSLDELHVITKDLCGEIPLRGFLGWREEYDRTHAVV
ncbi:hypothetical protein C8F04DRAFT_650188, partial [Mycena alexandri]